MTAKLQKMTSEKLKTSVKLKGKERNSKIGGEKSQLPFWSYYRATARTGQRLTSFLLRLVSSLDCYGLSQWRAKVLCAYPPDSTREMIMCKSCARYLVGPVSDSGCVSSFLDCLALD